MLLFIVNNFAPNLPFFFFNNTFSYIAVSVCFFCFWLFLLGVLALSWYPPDSNDENGDATDYLVPTILDKAHKYNLKVFYLFLLRYN